MTLAELYTQLLTTKLPVAYNAFPIGNAPALPFICYRATDTDNFPADNGVYLPVQNVDVELYTENKSPTDEATVESALSGFVWEKSEDYIPDERMFCITYSISF